MGLIPPATKMISTILVFPQDGDVVEANKDFTISVLSTNIKLGVFTNAELTYLAAPQTLDPTTSEIIGHTHVTVQPITDTTTPPDPTKFAFFKVGLHVVYCFFCQLSKCIGYQYSRGRPGTGVGGCGWWIASW